MSIDFQLIAVEKTIKAHEMIKGRLLGSWTIGDRADYGLFWFPDDAEIRLLILEHEKAPKILVIKATDLVRQLLEMHALATGDTP